MQYYSIIKEEWDKALGNMVLSHRVFASIGDESGQDYEPVSAGNIGAITYNSPKPVTPLKSFFLPFRENVTSGEGASGPRIIIGIPNCDIEALSLLDAIYLDGDFNDIFYRERRENTLLISADCFEKQENCHCVAYGIKPFATDKSDLGVVLLDGLLYFRVITEKGLDLIKGIPGARPVIGDEKLRVIEEKHRDMEELLSSSNSMLPDYKTTGELIIASGREIWEKYSSQCVSCGACSSICPTCSCFLLVEKPGFEKVRQLDACQYPGFERVAGGEDALFEIQNRFRNRYLCKYVWKPQKFSPIACTGCGRCIDACLGRISKNEIFVELSKQQVC